MSKKDTGLDKIPLKTRKKLFFKKCETKQELAKFIQVFFGLYLPDVTVSRYADTNPLNIIWEVYDICVNKRNPYDIEELLYVAGRGSGKTLGMAIAELLVMLHDERDVCHVGAVIAQAKRCYEYQTNFMLSNKIRPILEDKQLPQEERVLQKLNMEKSAFLLDGKTVTLEVLPCTLKACNGPHVPLVVTDEIDTVSGEGLKAFKEISGMLDTKGDKKALRVGISTRKSRYGLMNRMMEDAESAGRHVRRWTAWEFTERCPDERSGLIPTVSYHIQDDMEVVNEATFKMKDPKKQKEYTQHIMPGEKCLSCPAAAICLGDAKNQTSKSWMLKPVSELIKKVRSEGTDWALAQLMNLKPSVEGIIYKEFEEKIHVKDWNAMWRTLTGIDFPGECSHDIFVKKCHSMRLPCYAGVDWGWSNPNTVVYFFIDKRDNVYVVRADGMTYVSQPEWIHYIKTKYNAIYRCQLYFPDVADQGAVTEMKKAGLPVSSESDKSINSGIQVIKKLLRVPGTNDTKMHVAKETNEPLISEFLTYHFKTSADGTITEMPDTEYDHWLDALRYPLTMLLGKGTMVVGSTIEVDKSNTIDSHGNYYKTPSPEEFCTVNNLRINTEEPDFTKLGKIGRLNDIDDDEDQNSSGGGFLWGF